MNKSRYFTAFVDIRLKKSASKYPPMPDSLFGCIRLHLHREPCSEAEGVFENSRFNQNTVFDGLIFLLVELLELSPQGVLRRLENILHISFSYTHLFSCSMLKHLKILVICTLLFPKNAFIVHHFKYSARIFVVR